MTKPSKEHFYFINALRTLSISMVVLSHIIAPLVWRIHEVSFRVWSVLAVLNSFLRPTVPLFVVTSGFLSLSPKADESPRTFLRKRFLRVFLPTVTWSIVYVGWNTFAGREPDFSWRLPLELLQKPASRHLWFMYMFLGLVLITPLVRVFLKSATKRDLVYAIFVSAIPIWIMLYAKEFATGVSGWFYIPFGYWGYYLMGAALRDVHPDPRLRDRFFGGAFIILALSAAGTYWLSTYQGWHYDNFLYDNLAPNMAGATLLLFLWFRTINFEKLFSTYRFIGNAVNSLSRHAFGIYLAHILVVEFWAWGFFGFRLSWQTVDPIFGTGATFVATMAMSWLAAIVLHRIQFISPAFLGLPSVPALKATPSYRD